MPNPVCLKEHLIAAAYSDFMREFKRTKRFACRSLQPYAIGCEPFFGGI
jgi:hypothetical protein